jgi:pyridinium-3,5-bisthiocarboxylic acid mononucleotide nickel chelatase
MKVAYFDCQFGAAGDMLLAALIGAGLPVEAWLAEIEKIALPPGSFKVRIEDVVRCSIASKKVHVHVGEGPEKPSEKNKVSQSQHAHDHEHGHSHDDAYTHEVSSDAHSNHDHHPERGLLEIGQIIEKSQISSNAKTLAKAIFQKLAEAEGSVHGLSAEQVHFHEVGAIDSIVDIVGFAIGYDLLKIDESIVSPLPLGSGTVKTAHGLLPVPGPAVTSLLMAAKAPIRSDDFKHECLTPTGAAILTTIATNWGNAPDMDELLGTGYGAGDFNPSQFPNVCRIIIGERSSGTLVTPNGKSHARFNTESILVIETNLDDFTPQALSFTCEQLFKLGALDVFTTPCLMKKGRSGHQLTVLAYPAESARLEEYILLQTTTLGVRKYFSERTILDRKWQEVTLAEGKHIRIKVAYDNAGNIIHSQPEYEDCAVYARTFALPIQEVFNQAIAKLSENTLIDNVAN